MKFENSFWSSDYITGIQALIHALEASGGETKDSLQYFKGYTDLLEAQSSKLKEISSKSEGPRGSRNHGALHDHSQILERFRRENADMGSLDSMKRVYADSASKASHLKTSLSLKIESDIVLRLEEFLEDYLEFISDAKKNLNNQYNAYSRSIQSARAAEKQYISKARELEDADLKDTSTPPPVPEKELPPVQPPTNESVKEVVEKEDEIFEFPLQIGSGHFANIEELKHFMMRLTTQIPLKRRIFPIPGINNEYFSSEDFFKWVRSNRINEDSRRKIEKFGQDMITLGLVSNWNKLAMNKFVSDEGYYELTDLARFIANFDTENIPEVTVTVPETPTAPKISSRHGVFDGLKKRLGQALDVDTLRQYVSDSREKYLELASKSDEERGKLEALIEELSRKSETYETNRVKLAYFTAKIFNDAIIEECQKHLQILQDSSNGLIYNESTLRFEVLQKSITNKSGWYWPKQDVKFPRYSNSKSFSNIEIFGNDLVNQALDVCDQDPKTKSVPLFLKHLIRHLSDVEDIGDLWSRPLDIKKSSEVKAFALNSVVEYEDHFIRENSGQDMHSFIVDNVAKNLFETFSSEAIIGILKLWLLELPDSVIPFLAYDSLKTAYIETKDANAKAKILGSIPRQNLSTLLFLAAHLSGKVGNIESVIINERVPLYHLLIRPSPKNVSADVDDIITFRPLCEDLINKDFQHLLFQKLEELEVIHLQREKRAEESLKSLRNTPKHAQLPPALPKSNSDNSLHVDENGLRPFKTRSPNPSPAASPRASRSRTNSNISNILLPAVKRPSDSLHRRTVSKNLDKDEALQKVKKAEKYSPSETKESDENQSEKKEDEKIVIEIDSE